MGNQVYTSALLAFRCTPVHYGWLVVHQCTMGNQVYTSALWAIRCSPVHYGQAGVHQCKMGKQMIHSYLAYSALWASRCTTVHICKYLNGKFNVMFLTWWCSLCASERGLTNGYGHSSIYCNQQSNWKIKMSCVYSDNLFNITLYLDFCWSRGRIRPRMKHPCYYYHYYYNFVLLIKM